MRRFYERVFYERSGASPRNKRSSTSAPARITRSGRSPTSASYASAFYKSAARAPLLRARPPQALFYKSVFHERSCKNHSLRAISYKRIFYMRASTRARHARCFYERAPHKRSSTNASSTSARNKRSCKNHSLRPLWRKRLARGCLRETRSFGHQPRASSGVFDREPRADSRVCAPGGSPPSCRACRIRPARRRGAGARESGNRARRRSTPRAPHPREPA